MMLVDDEPDILSVAKRGLEQRGYEVNAFTDPVEALESFEKDKNAFDVVVSDIGMSKMSGLKLARHLWNLNEKLQICFLTAFEINPREAKKMFPSLKNYCFLTKPLTASQLANHIESHCAIKR